MIRASLFSRRADVVFVFFLLIQLWHAWNEVLFSSLTGSFLCYANKDLLYIALRDSGVFQFVSNHAWVGVGLDILLFLLPVVGLLSFQKHYWMRALAVLYTFYFFYFNAVSGHHYHSSVLLLVVLYSFMFGEKSHEACWRFARYYGLFFMGSAALWKLFRGSIFSEDQLLRILQLQLAGPLWDYPESLRRLFFSEGDAFLPWLLWLAVSVQFVFLLGFFSLRFDDILFVLFIVFMVVNWLLMDIVSLELWIWLITLHPHGIVRQFPKQVSLRLFPKYCQ